MQSFLLALAVLALSPSIVHSQSAPRCSDIFSKSNSLRIEQGKVFERKSDTEFLVAVIERGYEFEATLAPTTGRLTIAAFLAFPEAGVRSHLRGGELFKDMIHHFGAHRIQTIVGRWIDGTNFDQFFAGLARGKTEHQAAAETWTGQQALLHGFGNVHSVHIKVNKMTGEKTVYAEFTR